MEADNNIIEELKQLTREHIEFSKKCSYLCEEIKSGNLSLTTLVEQLGPLLVDTSPQNRELGTLTLSHVLEKLPPGHLDHTQLQFVCAFYTDRFKDHHQVIPAVLSGILALSQFYQFPEGAATQILKSLFQNVACQQQREDDRLKIYRILSIFLEKFVTELCKMEYDFVYGVISAVDGERNPKNLLFLFQWFPKFFKVVTLGHLTEEAFEVLACYFPVDFRAPAQDPNAITREQLAEALAPCLTAIPAFAEFCLPLALDKLSSSLEIAKLDSLQLLELGCFSFETAAYAQHSTQLWSQLQREVFSGASPVVETAALSTLTAIIRKLSDQPNIKTTLKDLIDTLKGNLIPDARLFEPTAKLLLSVGAASAAASDQITREVAPILINTFNITSTVNHRSIVLGVLIRLFICYVDHHNALEFEDIKTVPVLCLKAARDGNVMGFEGLGRICQFLAEDVRFSLYEILRVGIQKGVCKSTLACLETLARSFAAEVAERVIGGVEITDPHTLRCYFEALIVIAPQQCFTDIVIDTLLRYLNNDLDLSRVVVEALRRIVEQFEDDDTIQAVLLDRNIVKVLETWARSRETLVETDCLQDVAYVLKTVIGKEQGGTQKELIRDLPLEVTCPARVFVINGLLSRLRPDVDIDYRILNDLTHLVLNSPNEFVKDTAVQLLANIINKCRDDMVLGAYMEQFNETTDHILLSWIVKALVIRNHSLANEWTTKLFKLLDIDQYTAACFRVVVNDSYDSLSHKSHCFRTVLYQQKFFTTVSNRLCQGYTPGRQSYLLALGYLLESAPRQAILLQFQKIAKHVVLCLDECDNPEVLIAVLRIVKDFMVTQENCLQEQISDFMTRFLKLATFEKSKDVRIMALQCLGVCTFAFPVYKLLIHKAEVLRVLGIAIDDKKRFVRREAMEARSLWFLVDAPL